jgi:O-antigen/teichoic acid export membrane protein
VEGKHEPTALGSQLIANTRWNLAGMLIPIALAVLATPILIDELGTARFGLLALAWAVMSYFNLLDLGLGQATTKFVSEHLARNPGSSVRGIVLPAFYGHLALGLAGGIVLAATAHFLTHFIFEIPGELREEAVQTFLLLALSVPLVIVATCLRGALEGYQLFRVVNITKIAGGILTYGGPLLVVAITNDLPVIVGSIVFGRAIILLVYGFAAVRRVSFRRETPRRGNVVIEMLRFGGFVSLTSLTAPVLTCLDRAFIAAASSLNAVAFYAIPYEVVTRLWIVSASLMTSLFPVFAAAGVRHAGALRSLYLDAFVFLLFVATPMAGVLIVFARELLTLWIGSELGAQCVLVAKWLTVGVLANVLAQAPYTLLVSAGHAKRIVRLHFGEVAVYSVLVWQLVTYLGAAGAAVAWTIRALIDAWLLLAMTERVLNRTLGLARPIVYPTAIALAFIAICFGLDTLLPESPYLKALVFLPVFALFLGWQYRVLHQGHTYHRVLSWMRQLLQFPRPSTAP